MLHDETFANPELEVVALRYFNPIGAHPSGRMGEDPLQTPNNLLPFVSQVAAGMRERVLVYGNSYPTVDGTGVRDYIHVMDLAAGHAAALEHIRPGFNAYNLGTGRGTSVLEIIDAFSLASGVTIPFQVVAERAGDIAESVADVKKAKQNLNWTASRTIEAACRDAWAWQIANPQGYQTS